MGLKEHRADGWVEGVLFVTLSFSDSYSYTWIRKGAIHIIMVLDERRRGRMCSHDGAVLIIIRRAPCWDRYFHKHPSETKPRKQSEYICIYILLTILDGASRTWATQMDEMRWIEWNEAQSGRKVPIELNNFMIDWRKLAQAKREKLSLGQIIIN